jgi:hypothetical protein
VRVIVPLDRLESYLSSYDVELLVRYGIPLHAIIAECIRVALEQSFEREIPMSKEIFIDELTFNNRMSALRLTDDRGVAPSIEDKITHCGDVMYIVYKQLFHYINRIAEKLFAEVGIEYRVDVLKHYILPDGGLFMDLDIEYLPFKVKSGVTKYVKTTTNLTYGGHRRGI